LSIGEERGAIDASAFGQARRALGLWVVEIEIAVEIRVFVNLALDDE
jgi:hypothetical protein